MSQQLVLPINDMRMTASYKNARYLQDFGFTHYGIDATSVSNNKAVYACGNGRVIACGADAAVLSGANSLRGNCVVIIYLDVQCNGGKTFDFACRIFHLDKISVKVGDTVTKNTVIGQYGMTGAYVTGPHLHIEFDTDIRYPQHALGFKSSGNIIQVGNIDSTVDPSSIWYLDQGQSIVGNYPGTWTFTKDINIPKLIESNQDEEVTRLKQALTELQQAFDKQNAQLEQAKIKLDSIWQIMNT